MTATLRPDDALRIEDVVRQLRADVRGDVITRFDSDYEALRLPWNRAFEHRPAVIVAPRSTSGVAAAVRIAARHRMPIVVQATGHGVVRTADDAMLLLTHHMNRVSVDKKTMTAILGGGAKWAHVLEPAAAIGLAPLLGSTPDVGAVGYTLGGGMGWIARKYGLSADRVRSFEIVTADGLVRRTSPSEDSDLFWALRGGGAGSLGVVTAMEIEMVPLTSLYAGNLLYPAELVRDVAIRYREWIEDVPDDLTSAITLMNFPDEEDVPEPWRGRSYTIVRGALIGSDEDGEALLAHWRGWRTPEADMWGRIPFAEIATVSNDPLDPLVGLGTTDWFDTISDAAIDVLARALFEGPAPNPLLMAEIRHAGGAVARPPHDAGSYGNRDRQHVLELVGMGTTIDDVPTIEAALAAVRSELAPHTAGGAYINFLDGAEKVDRSAEGFEPEAWERLRAIKTRVDPENLFSHGVAIA